MAIQSLSTLLIVAFISIIALPIRANECLSMHVVNNPPVGYINEAGEITGIHWELLTILEEKSGLCMNKKLLPYSRAWRSIQFGDHDGGILSRASERDPFVEYIAKLITLRTVVIPRKNLTLHTYDDLKNIVIGRVRATLLSDRFDNDSELNILELATYERAINMLKKGRIDAIAGSGLGLSVITRLGEQDYFNFSGKLIIGERELWLIFSKYSKHSEMIPQLRETMQELIKEGAFNDILIKYYGENWHLSNE